LTTPAKAVLYLRSSKDRHDVSIDAQRRQLTELAASRDLLIVGEFSDVVESGKDEDRPGFQALYAALSNRGREWATILLLDTSRLARRIEIAIAFEEREARPRGVQLVYKSLPDIDPIWKNFLKRQMQVMDELHSMLSRQKGLAGMRENVHKGFRAGGRAPLGYRLKHEPTGALRDGQPVLKSRLEPDTDARAVAQYLKLRAAGMARRSARAESGVDAPDTTLISVEWNALLYAGCTVWNVHNERTAGGYVGGQKRRARKEWVIKEGTHEPLITRPEAEALLADLDRRKGERKYRTTAAYLLSGILFTPSGEPWHGNRDGAQRLYYRCPTRSVRTETLDRAVLKKIAQDLASTKFAQRLARSARAMAEPDVETTAIARAYADIEKLDGNIAKVTAMLPEGPQRPLLEQIGKWELEREKIRAGIIGTETRLRQARLIASITEADVTKILAGLATDMPTDREALKDFVSGMVARITLDPATLQCRINYDIPAATGDFVASPRRHVEIPRLAAWTLLKVA
jgi:site-specific DNA recombinase